ncbi:MAG: VWA domain-containing protein, partial [Planctomycetaceae bacterium]|nr:VWA domain-containing protein [Planctomycetaceae bacterium]
MVTWGIAIAVFVLGLLAEWLHARRTKRIAYLAFGPSAKPRRWVSGVPVLRSLSLAAVVWGLLILRDLHGGSWMPESSLAVQDEEIHHVVIALDVSPSMLLTDAGADGRQSRAERARDVLRSTIERLGMKRTRISIVAFYGKARPVVVDTSDGEVVSNILNGLPLEHAFVPGKTNMYEAVKSAATIGKTWRDSSATLLLISDGDTLPTEKQPTLPGSFGNVRVLGVGDPHQGQWIDDHSSRQDERSLKQLALQLNGDYVNANRKHLSSDDLGKIAGLVPEAQHTDLGQREWAIFS